MSERRSAAPLLLVLLGLAVTALALPAPAHHGPGPALQHGPGTWGWYAGHPAVPLPGYAPAEIFLRWSHAPAGLPAYVLTRWTVDAWTPSPQRHLTVCVLGGQAVGEGSTEVVPGRVVDGSCGVHRLSESEAWVWFHARSDDGAPLPLVGQGSFTATP